MKRFLYSTAVGFIFLHFAKKNYSCLSFPGIYFFIFNSDLLKKESLLNREAQSEILLDNTTTCNVRTIREKEFFRNLNYSYQLKTAS